jgi:hypothetical protein
MKTNIILSAVIYFLLLSVIVAGVSYVLYGTLSHGFPALRVVLAFYFAFTRPLNIFK